MQACVLAARQRPHLLYSLSAEKKGKFVCTQSSGCLTLWKPLLVPTWRLRRRFDETETWLDQAP